MIIMTLSFEKDPKFTCGRRHWKGCELRVFVKCWKQSDLKSKGKLLSAGVDGYGS